MSLIVIGQILKSVSKMCIRDRGMGTLKRSKKKSFDWYKQVIASNGYDTSYKGMKNNETK